MFIKTLKPFKYEGKDISAGTEMEIDDATGELWLEANRCEKVANPKNDIVDQIVETIDSKISDVETRLTKKLSDGIKKARPLPAIAKGDAHEDWSLGEFLQLVGKAARIDTPSICEPARNVLANKYSQKTTQTQGTNADGGYLVPTIYNPNLWFAEGYDSVLFMNRVKAINMVSNVEKIPVLDQTVTPSGGSSAHYGNVAEGQVTETNTASTSAKFKQLTLTAVKYLATVDVSNELNDNNIIGLTQVLSDLLRKSTVGQIDYDMFNGNGSITGIVGHGSVIKVARKTANKFVLQDAAKMYARLNPKAYGRAFWAVSPTTLDQLIQFEDAAGRIVWLPNMSANGQLDLRLFGMPVISTDCLPALGTEGDVFLIDPDWIACGVNQDIRIASSVDYHFGTDLITYRLTARVAATPKATAPILLRDGSHTVSGLVCLDDLASG